MLPLALSAVAVTVAVPAVVAEVRVAVATPLASVTAGLATAPRVVAKATDWPGAGLSLTSLTRAVMVLVLVPSVRVVRVYVHDLKIEANVDG